MKEKSFYFDLPILTYEQIRAIGHRQQMGIYKPSKSIYAFSIITNAGEAVRNYEDSLSDDLILTYHGRGKERDQTLDDYDNYALALNFRDQVKVRVFAGSDNRYRDWGYWMIVDLATIIGDDGFIKLEYKLVPHDRKENVSTTAQKQLNDSITRFAERKIGSANRQVRYAPELRDLKKAYEYTCQVDGNHILNGRKGRKVNVHHIEPVGPGGALVTPHHSNEIVLCPNCHSLFDDGSLFIDPNDGQTLHHWDKDPSYEGKLLRSIPGHILDKGILKRVYRLHYEKDFS
jgi:putative restriction endonuclease